MNQRPIATQALIVANVVLFIVTQFIPEMNTRMYELFGLYFPENEAFRWWQLVTSIFMHGGPAHLFFNMFALYSFGMILEIKWGVRKFLTFYLVVGVGAGIIFTAINYFQFIATYNQLSESGIPKSHIKAFLDLAQPSSKILSLLTIEELRSFREIYITRAVGASGAIYGILVAFGILFPNAKLMLIFLPVPVAAKYFVPALLLFDLFSGVTGFSLFGGGIAHFAHIGGAIIGFLLMWFWGGRNKADRPKFDEVANE